MSDRNKHKIINICEKLARNKNEHYYTVHKYYLVKNIEQIYAEYEEKK